MPKKDGAPSPEELFYSIKSDYQAIREAKCWGCPAYVLDPKLQDGKKLPRWSPRSRLGQFLGRSKKHAGSVGLIKNLITGKISPQYHVVYDNHFTTIDSETNVDNIPTPKGFSELMFESREKVVDPSDLEQNKVHDSNEPNNEPVAEPPEETRQETEGAEPLEETVDLNNNSKSTTSSTRLSDVDGTPTVPDQENDDASVSSEIEPIGSEN
jgi:hypothetical protein